MKGGTITVLLATLVVVYADHHTGDHATQLPATYAHHEHEDDHIEDFNKLDDRLDHLTSRIVALEDKVAARVDPVRIRKARSLESRVVKLEGTHCGKRDYQCGGSDPQCVGMLLVCDGIKDCRNGADEEHCHLPVKAGDVFEGHMIFDHCTKRQPDGMDMHITAVQTSTVFTSFAKIRATVNIDYEDKNIDGHVAMPTVGYFSFGAHKLVFPPPESDRLYLVCEFDGGNEDRCVGLIKRESGVVCAKLIFVKKH